MDKKEYKTFGVDVQRLNRWLGDDDRYVCVAMVALIWMLC